MKYGTVGKVLAGIGALLMLRAMTMSVVGGTFDGQAVANLSLMNERSNTLMLGGFLMIAGVILYAVSKLKQTPEDEKMQAEDRQAAMDQLINARNTATTKALSTSKTILPRFIAHFRSAPDARVNRLATGMFVGICAGVTVVGLMDVAWPLLFAIVALTIWRAFGNSPGYRRIRNLHLANLLILAMVPLSVASISLQREGGSYGGILVAIVVVTLPMLVSLIWIYLSRPGRIY